MAIVLAIAVILFCKYHIIYNENIHIVKETNMSNLPNKNIREMKEMQNLFADPKFSRQAWKAVGLSIAMQPATKPAIIVDKDGNETTNSKIEQYSYNKLQQDIKQLGKENREPTELEMILACQMVKARTDTAAATFIRDTLGAKPVDESKVDAQLSNPYEQLTDEELEMLQREREKKALEAAKEQLPSSSAAQLIVKGEIDEKTAD